MPDKYLNDQGRLDAIVRMKQTYRLLGLESKEKYAAFLGIWSLKDLPVVEFDAPEK